MMSDNENPIKPLGKINFFGREETKQPFSISGMKWKGLYYYIFVDDLQQLLKINESYKSIKPKFGIEPLREVRLVGGGNVIGYKPFLYKGRQSICILSDHLHQLMKINREYKKLLRKKVRKKPIKPTKKMVKPVRKIEKPEVLFKLTEKGLEEAKKVKPKSVKRIRKRPKKKVIKKPKPRKIVKPKPVKRRVRRAKPIPKKKRKITKPQVPKLLKNLKRIFRKTKPKKIKKKIKKRKIARPKASKFIKSLKRIFR